MVDSVNNAAGTNALIRATQATDTGALRSSRAIAQTILNSSAPSSTITFQGKVLNVAQAAKAAASTTDLPRGSIVDVLV